MSFYIPKKTKPKFTTAEDDIILQKIADLTSHEADAFHLFINGVPTVQIAIDLNLSINYLNHVNSYMRHNFSVKSLTALAVLVIPAMIRKECEEFLEEE
jgi:FixJ family two-component response regulator